MKTVSELINYSNSLVKGSSPTELLESSNKLRELSSSIDGLMIPFPSAEAITLVYRHINDSARFCRVKAKAESAKGLGNYSVATENDIHARKIYSNLSSQWRW